MGVETIVFYAAGAGAMAALAPTSAVIREGNGDALIVGVVPMGVTLTKVVLACSADLRWESGGIAFPCKGNGGVQDNMMLDAWNDKKIPIKRGGTLVATQTGAGVGYCFVYVEYPDIGESFAIRQPIDETAFEVTKTLTAAAALTANTISSAAANGRTTIADWVEDRLYRITRLFTKTGGTGPEIAVGWQDPKTNLWFFVPIPISATLASGKSQVFIPQGALTPRSKGTTLNIDFVSIAADTPAVESIWAYSK